MNIILASASAGRKKILESLHFPFTVIPADIDERKIIASNPITLVKRIARAKALAVLENVGAGRDRPAFSGEPRLAPTIIIAADSMVLFRGKTYGKPKDKKEAIKMLTMLSGQTHEFITGLCVLALTLQDHLLQKLIVKSCKSYVTFEKFTKEEIEKYVSVADVTKFAGGFAPDLKGGELIKPKMHIKGSKSNVLGGLPLEILLPNIEEFLLKKK